MKIGVPKEIKNNEYRVGLTPASVRELTARGHAVLVECNAGAAIGLSDEQYRAAGATSMEAKIPAASAALPLRVTVKMKFGAKIAEQPFDFQFNEYSKDVDGLLGDAFSLRDSEQLVVKLAYRFEL